LVLLEETVDIVLMGKKKKKKKRRKEENGPSLFYIQISPATCVSSELKKRLLAHFLSLFLPKSSCQVCYLYVFLNVKEKEAETQGEKTAFSVTK
jgi:hypothetical protein